MFASRLIIGEGPASKSKNVKFELFKIRPLAHLTIKFGEIMSSLVLKGSEAILNSVQANLRKIMLFSMSFNQSNV